MSVPQTDATTDLQGVVAALQQRLDAALSEKAALAEKLAARDATLAQRNTEYSERIEHQTATVDVLRVMSASPGDTQPVFDLIVRRAVELCNAQSGGLFEYDGERVHIGTIHGLYEHDGKLLHVQSLHGTEPDIAPASLAAYLRQFPMPPNRGSISMRAILDRQILHIRDMRKVVDLLEDVQRLGHRSQVSLPLLRDARAIGVITIAAHEPGGFSDSQVALLRTFAEQAVIAITSAETYRALQTRTSDLQETLEYQTATSDVLKVISQSTFDLQPVLDTVVETAARLCNADQAAMARPEGDFWRLAATFGFPAEYEAYYRATGAIPYGPGAPSVTARAVREKVPVHIHDVAAIPGYPDVSIRLGKQRTSLAVPLLREGQSIGVIVLGRQRVEPFTDRQIQLVRTFADQAAIAIENTRLLTEQREALEQQTATAEVLQVINANPGNLAPVFDAILEKAHSLCGVALGELELYEDGKFRAVAMRGVSGPLAELLRQPFTPPPNSPLARLLAGEPVVQFADLFELAQQRPDDRRAQAGAQYGLRTVLFVPLRKDDTLLGYITAYRQEVRPFSEREIALLQNFAAQAVIAMENTRLITEISEALEQQTATADVLQVINASPGNLTPVFDAILKKAHILCGAEYGVLLTYDGEVFWPAAVHGDRLANSESFRRGIRAGFGFTKLLRGERLLHIQDMAQVAAEQPEDPVPRALFEISGIRTQLAVPLRRDDKLLGVITANRREVRPFAEKEIALLENFAAQAVIAMENARLITEQREALEQQTATAEVLQVINASPGDLTPVYDAMLEKAMHLCGGVFGSLTAWDGKYANVLAMRGYPPALAQYMAARGPRATIPPVIAQLAETRRPQQVADVVAGEGYRNGHPVSRAVADLGGARTILHVPLRKDEAMLGYISVYRQEVRAFTDKQIALLENFAAQAVIAMENARLLNEIRQRQEELRITFENMGDGVAMFDETQYLAAWNRKFQDILDLPDALLEQRRTYEEHLRFLAARGDFGPGVDTVEQIEELVASTGQPYGYERTRPGGRVIEIRRNPVPGGGFVLIYSDITERKRSEEEIRAARDAAETALRELKTAQANLIQAEKMASLGQLTAGIAHEIKNPLNFVNNFAALSVDLLSELKETAASGFAALTETQRAEVEEVSVMLTSNLEKITEHGKRADGIVKAMLEHSRGSSGERRMVDLNVLIDEALNLAYHGARAQDQSFNITLERNFGEGIAPIEVNPQDITRVFLNLFSNGFYATTKRARPGEDAGFLPTLKVITRDAGDAVEIRVRDNGTGIPADIRDKLFQPFFTTKPTGEGTGLGLSITYDIVTQQHGGSIAVDSNVGEYSEFTIQLPRNP